MAEHQDAHRLRDEPHADRFPSAMHHAERVTSHEWDGADFQEGQRVGFFTTTSPYGIEKVTMRVEGTIAELWCEDWHGTPLPYAEVDLDDGSVARAWFHRDHVAPATGLVGAQLEGALW